MTTLEDVPDAIRVCVRVRPLIQVERDAAHTSKNIEVLEERNSVVLLETDSRGRRAKRTFKFDTVIGPMGDQGDLFRQAKIAEMVKSLLRGFHATIFAYGQTSSGKTHSMEGYNYDAVKVSRRRDGRGIAIASTRDNAASIDFKNIESTAPEKVGVTPRVIRELFSSIRKQRVAMPSGEENGPNESERMYTIRCSFVQIYSERVYDLLGPRKSSDLRVRWDRDREFYVEGAVEEVCGTAEEALLYFHRGLKHKIMATHNLNEASSRAHTLFTLDVESRQKGHNQRQSSGSAEELEEEKVLRSRLTLVDLAGSERVKQTGAEGVMLMEAQSINTSLMTLRKVMKALSQAGRAGPADGGEIDHGNERFEKNKNPHTLTSLLRHHKSTGEGDENNQGMCSTFGTLHVNESKHDSSLTRPHVPYRESSLTKLLKHSLGGNSVTLMIACISPSDLYATENLSTLSYASLARAIRLTPVVNTDSESKLVRKLRQKIASLEKELFQAHCLVESTITAAEDRASVATKLSSEPSPGGNSDTATVPGNLGARERTQMQNATLVKEMLAAQRKLRHEYAIAEEEREMQAHQCKQLLAENMALRSKLHKIETDNEMNSWIPDHLQAASSKSQKLSRNPERRFATTHHVPLGSGQGSSLPSRSDQESLRKILSEWQRRQSALRETRRRGEEAVFNGQEQMSKMPDENRDCTESRSRSLKTSSNEPRRSTGKGAVIQSGAVYASQKCMNPEELRTALFGRRKQTY
jgi:hypothetical protein